MGFENILKKYDKELQELEFEITFTPRLGWISVATDYYIHSDPIKQFKTPDELEEYILDMYSLLSKNKKAIL